MNCEREATRPPTPEEREQRRKQILAAMPFWQRMKARVYGLQEEPAELRVPEMQPAQVERKWAAVPQEKLRLHLAALAIEEYERYRRNLAQAQVPADSAASSTPTPPAKS